MCQKVDLGSEMFSSKTKSIFQTRFFENKNLLNAPFFNKKSAEI
jgi:hypothetical protein